MKHILMICNHFAPDNTIAAVRITKFAKYLKMSGYDVTVIAEKKQEEQIDSILKNDSKEIEVFKVSNSANALRKINFYKKVTKRIRQKGLEKLSDRVKVNHKTGKKEFYPFQTAHPIIGSLDFIVETYRQHDLFLSSKQLLQKMKNVDIVFASYGDFFSIYAGGYFHRIYPEIPWVMDIRDAICRYKFTTRFVKPYTKYYEKKIAKDATAITCVSEGICRQYKANNENKVFLITNGFDRTDRVGLSQKYGKKGIMKFVYTGSMYGGIQNLEPLFKCVHSLIIEKIIEKEKILFEYAGNKSAFEIFERQAEKYDLSERCNYKGKLERKEALTLQNEADILLVASYDYKSGYGGVITGKALEYMSAGKPIISIVSGDINGNELTQIIRDGDLGFAYEEANEKSDFIAMKEYLKKIYQQFCDNKKIYFKPKSCFIEKYDYEYLTGELINIFEQTERREKE